MFTAWVVLTTGQRPRRTHRMHIDGITKCGINTRFRIRFVRRWTPYENFARPKFCHVCFKYKYRAWSKREFVASRDTLRAGLGLPPLIKKG